MNQLCASVALERPGREGLSWVLQTRSCVWSRMGGLPWILCFFHPYQLLWLPQLADPSQTQEEVLCCLWLFITSWIRTKLAENKPRPPVSKWCWAFLYRAHHLYLCVCDLTGRSPEAVLLHLHAPTEEDSPEFMHSWTWNLWQKNNEWAHSARSDHWIPLTFWTSLWHRSFSVLFMHLGLEPTTFVPWGDGVSTSHLLSWFILWKIFESQLWCWWAVFHHFLS